VSASSLRAVLKASHLLRHPSAPCYGIIMERTAQSLQPSELLAVPASWCRQKKMILPDCFQYRASALSNCLLSSQAVLHIPAVILHSVSYFVSTIATLAIEALDILRFFAACFLVVLPCLIGVRTFPSCRSSTHFQAAQHKTVRLLRAEPAPGVSHIAACRLQVA